MNFRTSHLAGLLASALLVLSSTSGLLSAAEPLNITGPDGESRQTLRQYGPTTASDTFWSIAQKTRPDASVTIYQVMAAIYEANPHAFTSDNYNSLEKGMILLIPSKEVMLAIPKSLAKQQAESNDKGWRQKPQTAAKPKPVVTQTKQAQASEASQPEMVQADKPSAEQQKQIEALTAKLEAEQAKNLSLTDELARAQDKLNLGNNDSEMLQAKIDEQSSRIAELEEALLVQKEQKAQLNSEVEQLRQQLAAATQPAKPKEVDDSWRTMMDNPLYLGLFAAIPALLLLVLVWLFIKRRNNKSEAVESSTPVTPPMDDKPVAPAPEDSEEMMAVHLDTDDEADSLDSLMKVDETQLKPEADLSDELPQEAAEMVVDAGDEQVMSPIEDEGQSLDDLWAEAMGEQEQEEAKTTQEDDLDSLLAELDAPQEAPIEETHVEEKSIEETAFEAPTFEEEATTETDLDELLAEFEQETPSEDAKEEDLDALLAEFDLPAETANEEANVEEIKPEEAVEPEATAASEETLADEIAQELEEAIEAKGDEGDVDETDLDALLAGFDAEPAAQATDSEDDEIARQIAAELEEENDEVEEADLDALLAEFEPAASTSEPEAEVADLEFAEAEAEETAPEETGPELDVAAELAAEQEESKPAGHAPLEFDLGEDKPAVEAEAEEEIKAEDDGEVDLDALLADLESVEEAEEPKVEKGESGFFGDLKGNKRSSDNMLEWESALTSDAPSTQETPVEDDDDAISLQLDDDDNLTVDQALAALDAAEKKRPARAVPEHDLTAFQQDNGFIDIDRLLNEADEEQLDVDKYKELDVDMGELDSLMGNAAMVDVDDEENAVNAKLDLARAYIEIDDMDSAKALLKEVELDGNERQQQEAKKLLDEL
ncbi:FimV/HubP family polar landmark protein [Shewanella aegiceratis]|uniref:FimV/HubP family polar landmark protein n=1 Tax=Shewanella aegiceratis TaxID=2864203 RepID=UPI001C65D3CD|nr:FimV/HubP family polar landmark protein [Shewanella aegiceratis]QYJ81012.1 hypothetical protein K0H80_11765 [Shewanella aegiceratis]